MVKLLMRFYDVNSGQILLDNHDVRDYNRRDLRKAFGMVLQDTYSIKELYGKYPLWTFGSTR
ncbi:MAG: hypothetical protein ACLRYY_06240 [Anaerobutyricum soehngenii]